MSERVGVEGAKKIILSILSTTGTARWSDFEKQGLPKATILRALRELMSEGLVEKRGKLYVLVAKRYDALIRGEYGPTLCELIPGCLDVEKLVEDLLKEVGESINRVEEMYSKFINKVLQPLGKTGVVSPLYETLLKAFYQNKGFFAIMIMEITASFFIKKLIDEGCADIFIGLDNKYTEFLKRTLEESAKSFTNTFDIKVDELIDALVKLRRVLVNHGYREEIRIKVLSVEIPINIKEVMISSYPLLAKIVTTEGIIKCFNVLQDISKALMVSGCRPLGSLEKESLIRNCSF